MDLALREKIFDKIPCRSSLTKSTLVIEIEIMEMENPE
jgi:hypothetical protein